MLAALGVALAAQLAWHARMPAPEARRTSLPPPPSAPVLRLVALGEPSALAAGGALWLQFFDEQPGVSIPYRELDYDRVRGWLERLLALEPASDYPMLLAVRLYGQVNDDARQRKMLTFVFDAFGQRPRARWRWLAEAAILAEHDLGDRKLALRFAKALTGRTQPGEIPHWARDLQILLLEDLGRYRAAKVLIGGMLASGAIQDPAEIRYLERKLQALKQRAPSSGREKP